MARFRDFPRFGGEELFYFIGEIGFSPDGSLFFAEWRSQILFWKVAIGRPLRPFRPKEFYWNSPTLSPDGKMLAACDGLKGRILLWERVTGGLRLQFAGHVPAGASAVSFSPDGKFLASAGFDNEVRVWDVASGQQVWHAKSPQWDIRKVLLSRDRKFLISVADDNTALVWDVKSLRPARSEGRTSKEPMDKLWADLAGADAARAYRAIVTLAYSPAQSVPFLESHLRPAVSLPGPGVVAHLITDLASNRYAVRREANRKLAEMPEVAEPALKRLLKENPPLDVRRQVERLLSKFKAHPLPVENLRNSRAVEVLERIGSPESQKILRTLARGVPEAEITREALASLERLRKGARLP